MKLDCGPWVQHRTWHKLRRFPREPHLLSSAPARQPLFSPCEMATSLRDWMFAGRPDCCVSREYQPFLHRTADVRALSLDPVPSYGKKVIHGRAWRAVGSVGGLSTSRRAAPHARASRGAAGIGRTSSRHGWPGDATQDPWRVAGLSERTRTTTGGPGARRLGATGRSSASGAARPLEAEQSPAPPLRLILPYNARATAHSRGNTPEFRRAPLFNRSVS